MIRKATHADLDGILDIYDAIFRREEGSDHPCTTWKRDVYPTSAMAEDAIQAGILYVDIQGGDVAAAIILDQQQPDEYAAIPWAVSAPAKEVLVPHTLAVHPVIARKGFGRKMIAFAEGMAAGLGCRVIRLDTYAGNRPARAFYQKLGYREAGEATMHGGGDTYVCLEKLAWKQKK